MRQFLGFVVLVLFATPFGLSVAGCGRKAAVQYCSGNLESGPQVGQVAKITLAPNLTLSGESLNYGQIGTGLSASAQDCNGGAVSVSNYLYNSADPSIADINPVNGTICGGTWNRNSGGGIADFTICTPPAATNTRHQTFIYATANGATSNAIAIYIHAPVTNVTLGAHTANCDTDPDTTCATSAGLTCNQSTAGTNPNFPPYTGFGCVSQQDTRQLIARVFDAGNNNITCQVGPLTFTLQGATAIAAIDAQGFATADAPGSALVTATVSNSSSAVNSGFFSVCPPAFIALAAVNQPAGASQINVALNTAQSFTATVFDTNTAQYPPNGHPITGLTLEFNSTLPLNFPAASGSVTPVFPGTATITAVCNPPTCNPAPFSQIGVDGNGKPITSNGITVTATGTSASVLYMASTNSQFIATEDFTTGQLGSPIKLPFVPNSMVISQDGSTLYLGSPQGMMVVATNSNTVTNTFTTVQGTVLAASPNNTYAVVTDPTRQTVSLVQNTGAVFTGYNGVGTRAAWTPDSNTLYVLANGGGANSVNGTANELLTYSTFTGWQTVSTTSYADVAVTVPAVGAYFAGNPTEGRSYCSNTTANTGIPPVALNAFYPLADLKAVPTDRLAATTDGHHILGATAQAPATLQDFAVTLPVITACPLPGQPPVAPGYFTSTPSAHPLIGLTAATITGVVPSSNSGTAFVTYTGTGGVLPLYQPAAGTLTNVPLSSGATAPVAGVFSSDDTTFYAGTSGDNLVHIIKVNGAGSTDTGTLTPNLLDPNNHPATPNLIAQRVRRTTS